MSLWNTNALAIELCITARTRFDWQAGLLESIEQHPAHCVNSSGINIADWLPLPWSS